MEDIDSLDYHTQVAIKQLEVEKTKYKLKYKNLCNLISMLHDEAVKQNDRHMVRMMDLINSLQFRYCDELKPLEDKNKVWFEYYLIGDIIQKYKKYKECISKLEK